ncbi:hypothetical protein GCM10011416_12810 [Polaribacter pacificus]|uniref:Cytochrome C n=1 Tax=Polaribacter pacificus TaxID=1775173 RepID=A0A917HYV4_9FLAO|nr:hypothetical protein [Polaribacter pacificus]GGG96469.1 hypothetical protein GCM10011416_12810 [Polaribacter pacificus]
MRTFFLIAVLLLVSCAQNQEKPTVVIEKNSSRQTSEMATLMLQMFEVNMQHKELISNGEAVKGNPNQFTNIYTAKFTDPTEEKPNFEAYADLYMDNFKKVFEAQDDLLKQQHNNVIQSCIACHQTTCPGPISKIKKLILP